MIQERGEIISFYRGWYIYINLLKLYTIHTNLRKTFKAQKHPGVDYWFVNSLFYLNNNKGLNISRIVNFVYF